MKAYKAFCLLAMLPALCSAELSQAEKNDIRKHYQEETFNRPAQIRNRTPDQRYMEHLFREDVLIDEEKHAPLPNLPRPQIFAGRSIEFKQFIEVLSKSLGYNSPVFLHIPLSTSKTPITVNSETHDLAQLVEWLELESGAEITVYPEAKTIQVTAENDLNSSGPGEGRL